MDPKERFRNTLAMLIKASGKPKQQIAKEIGMVPAVISDYLSGRNSPSIYVLPRLCQSLDCTYEDLLGPVGQD